MAKDHTDVRQGKGHGYRGLKKGSKVCMIRCFKCGSENWAPAVASGTCAWCGFDANKPLTKREDNDGPRAA